MLALLSGTPMASRKVESMFRCSGPALRLEGRPPLPETAVRLMNSTSRTIVTNAIIKGGVIQ